MGVYGLVRYAVSRRHRELGVRMAVGCEAGRLVAWVVRGALAPVSVGVLVGLVLSIWTNRLLRTWLLGPGGPGLRLTVAVGPALVLVATVAAWLPARRAGRVDVVAALRAE